MSPPIHLDLNLAPPAPQPPPPPRRSRIRTRAINGFIQPPYPWASNHRAKVESLQSLLSRNIRTITGQVQCQKCEYRRMLEFDLESKFREIGSFICINKEDLCERAPEIWMRPQFTICTNCERPGALMKPVLPSDKKSINWLFLLLGQMLGSCTLNQLKYFCKHNSMHRTGAKDRLLYETYLRLCKQLDPTGPFDR